jgi:hypothetical protein
MVMKSRLMRLAGAVGGFRSVDREAKAAAGSFIRELIPKRKSIPPVDRHRLA